MLPTDHFLFLGAFLFSAGLIIVIIKKNMIMVLLGIELMLNASNLNLVAFNQLHAASIQWPCVRPLRYYCCRLRSRCWSSYYYSGISVLSNFSAGRSK